MHISGILVRTAPEQIESCAASLAALDGVEVDRVDESYGSVVVVLETGTREEQEELLRRIQRLPGIAFAELVCHLIDPPEEGLPAGEAEAVPPSSTE